MQQRTALTGLPSSGTHVADLVEEDRAAVDLFEFSDATLIGTRKGSSFMTEQFAFEQRLLDSGKAA